MTRVASVVDGPPRRSCGRRWRASFRVGAALFALVVLWGGPTTAQNVLSRALQERIRENPHTTEADVEAYSLRPE